MLHLINNKYLLFDPNELRDTMFNYETEQGRFQIFRMDRHPLSYFDIGQNARLTETKGQFGSNKNPSEDLLG